MNEITKTSKKPHLAIISGLTILATLAPTKAQAHHHHHDALVSGISGLIGFGVGALTARATTPVYTTYNTPMYSAPAYYATPYPAYIPTPIVVPNFSIDYRYRNYKYSPRYSYRAPRPPKPPRIHAPRPHIVRPPKPSRPIHHNRPGRQRY